MWKEIVVFGGKIILFCFIFKIRICSWVCNYPYSAFKGVLLITQKNLEHIRDSKGMKLEIFYKDKGTDLCQNIREV